MSRVIANQCSCHVPWLPARGGRPLGGCGQLRDGRKCSRCDGDREGEKDEVEEDYLFSASRSRQEIVDMWF